MNIDDDLFDLFQKQVNDWIKNKEEGIQKQSHTHEWKRYIGLTRVFDYCDCGEKKNEL